MNLPRSITLRLTLLFAAASTTVLLALGSALGLVIQAHFDAQDQTELRGKLELVRHALALSGAPFDREALAQRLDDALIGHAGLSLAVVQPDGEPLYTAGDAVSLVAALRAAPPPPSAPVTFVDDAHSGILAAAGPTGGPPLRIAIALDTRHHRHFMAAFSRTLWLLIALGIGASGLLGWLAARVGLASMRRIAAVAQAIGARQLKDRLPPEGIPPELRELAGAFNGMLDRLEDAFRRLSDFSSDIAHELRAPVNNLMTQTQVALSKPRPVETYREILASNLEEYDRLARMIGDMLFLAQADHGLIVPQRETVNLRREVDELIEFYEALAEESGIGLAAEGEGAVPGDRLMLRRALSNLLANALRHTPRGGTIHLRIARNGVTEVRIQVENPGPDIHAHHLGHLFDRFYRADPARERHGEGAGLGLAITQSILAAHGGRIGVESSGGRTVFEVLLPVRSPKAQLLE